MIRYRNEKRNVMFLILAVIFLLGFLSFALDFPSGLTVYEFVNEGSNQTDNALILETNQSIEEALNETLIENATKTEIVKNETNLTEVVENITLINITEVNITDNI